MPESPGWLGSPDAPAALASNAEAAGRDWTFGWLRVDTEAGREETDAALAALGVDVEGRAGTLLRVRLPGDAGRLRAIAALPAVVGLGAPPPSAKMPAGFAEEARGRPAQEILPVFVTLAAAGDADGRWRGELERLGAVVGAYDADTRSYAANVSYGILDAVAAADFVAFVEPVGIVEAGNDTAAPAMGADAYRTYTRADGWAGTAGQGVAVGVMDTGLNINHVDIGSGRRSVCGANFVSRLAEEEDLWVDADGHGTHVTATVAGNGAAEPRYAGMAPLAPHIRFAKVLKRDGFGWGTSVLEGMDFLAEESACEAAGWSDDAVKPPIVNMSLGSSSLTFEGRDTSARKLDAVVWNARQLYVVANANDNVHGFSNYGAAKNSLAVGAAYDSGELVHFSSLGPTADGRLAPLVVGTGYGVYSARGGGSRSGYRALNGTSMSSPSVAGVAALLMDAEPGFQWDPALARALLMSSAIKPDAWLDDRQAFPADNTEGPGTMHVRYGMGKVSGTTSVFERPGADGWRSVGWHGILLGTGEYTVHDIDVPEGATRLDLVLTWDEPAADVVADTVLNDLDLWLDEGGDCADARCGERSSRSRRDNVEWIVVRNPRPGIWKAKVVAERVYGDRPRAALAHTVIRGPSTPQLAVTADRDALGGSGEITLTVSADGYVAAGARIGMECRAADGAPCGTAGATYEAIDDGAPPAGRHDMAPGGFVALGEIRAGESRRVQVRGLDLPGNAGLHFTATGWNALADTVAVYAEETGADGPSRPANDDFADAAAFADSAQGDLLLATTEPGEPAFESGSERPAASVWYRWTATAAGPVHFSLAPGEAFRELSRPTPPPRDWVPPALDMRVEAYRGPSVAGVHPVASGPWGASFVAEAGAEYVVRVASRTRTAPFALTLREGGPPGNDAFAAAAVLDGGDGSATGTNAGATLDPGEVFGALAATVWYRWTAPADGWYAFGSSAARLKLLAFRDAASVGDLRLVSGFPRDEIRFPAKAGDTYRIAVASAHADAGGASFELSWAPTEEEPQSNDLLEDGWTFASSASGSGGVSLHDSTTVEPGEPPESGVRTQWHSWTAPETAEFTWRLTAHYAFLRADYLSLAAFKGDSLDGLEFVGDNGGATGEFTFVAEEGSTYRFAAGAAGDHAFRLHRGSGTLVWGPTPANDSWARADVLAAAAGTVRGSNRFATVEPDERIRGVGHSSLWWSFEAPAAGWYRFWIEGGAAAFTLSAHVHDPDAAPGRLGLVASSERGPSNGVEVFLRASEAGERFAVRIGTRGDAEGRDFTLSWEESEPPVWLRYAGATGERLLLEGEDGAAVELEGFGSVAVDDDGRAVYAAVEGGIAAFARDAHDGALELTGRVESAAADPLLLWDGPRDRLLAFDGCSARAYSKADDDAGTLEDGGDIPIANDGDCTYYGASGGRVFADPAGSFVYLLDRRRWGGLQVFTINEDGTLTHVHTNQGYAFDAAISDSGGHLYTVAYGTFRVLERAETGELAEVGSMPHRYARNRLTAGRDDNLVFMWGGKGVAVVDVGDTAHPSVLGEMELPQGSPLGWVSHCRFAAARDGRDAADAFCANPVTDPAFVPDLGAAYALEWRGGELAVTDLVADWASNRYNDLAPGFRDVTGFAASPDGRHAYAATPEHGILAFERVGNVEDDDLDVADLAVYLSSIAPPRPEAGQRFTLRAVVRNEGAGRSGGTTLRFYRSAGETISTADAAVGSAAVAGLDPSTDSTHAVTIAAPSESGIYYYGACVEEEAVPGGNCSVALRVRIGYPDLVVESPAVDDASPDAGASFEFSATLRNAGDGDAEGTTLRYFRSPDDTVSAEDAEVGSEAADALEASGTSAHTVALAAPSAGGTYYFGACADAVADESDTDNNCSDAVAVEVDGGVSGAPDLVVEAFTVSNPNPSPDEAFQVNTTVRNRGDGAATSYTLTIYVSADDTISSQDTVYTSFALGRLQPDAASISATAVSGLDPGIRYFGACVEDVPDESDTGNNCSAGVRVVVRASVAYRPSGEGFGLGLDHRDTRGVVYANDRFHVVNGPLRKVFAYRDGERDEEADFALDTRFPKGMAYANDRFHVVAGNQSGAGQNMVYAYRSNGERDAAADFGLKHPENQSAQGIVHANGRFYVVDQRGDKVYAYTEDGERDAAADFDLGVEDAWSEGIAFADDRFYVVSAVHDRVYAYASDGIRDPAADFPLDPENGGATGIARADRGLFVLDPYDDRVYAYRSDDAAPTTPADFVLDANAPRPRGLAFGGERFYVFTQQDDVFEPYRIVAYDTAWAPVPGFGFELSPKPEYGADVAYAGDRFYVPDYREHKVYAYDIEGGHDEEDDFDLDADNRGARGIVVANERFHVVDLWRGVFAYGVNGDRLESADFDLASENDLPDGIAYANERFYVPDSGAGKVYAYGTDGTRDEDADFDLDAGNTAPTAIAYADGEFYVIDALDKKVYAYPDDGGAQVEFALGRSISTDADGAESVHAADLDGDGDADVLSASSRDDKISWYENEGGVFEERAISTAADGAKSVYAADLDGDGDADVLSASWLDDKIAWYENQGAGEFSAQRVITTVADGARSVHAADLDGDGDADVLSAQIGNDRIAWYENLGGGEFSPVQRVITTDVDRPESVRAADLDGDGDADVLTASYNDDKIAWHENLGDGSFSAQRVLTTDADGARSVHAADLDADGDADLLSASILDNKIAWHENLGGNAFSAPRVVATDGRWPNYVHTADLDGDGDPDVLSAWIVDDEIAWHGNLGGGGFSAQKAIATDVDRPESVHAADLDGDGDPDVLSASSDDDRIAWYENLSDHGDDHADAADGATFATSLPAFLHGRLESAGDKDVFRVATGRGTLRVYSNGPADTFGTLLDAGGRTLASNDDAGTGLNFRIEADVAAGAHYVEVRGYANTRTGPYTLSIEFVLEPDGGTSASVVSDAALPAPGTPRPSGSHVARPNAVPLDIAAAAGAPQSLRRDMDTTERDGTDYYVFTVPERLAFGLGASGQTFDVDVSIENDAGTTLIESWPPMADPDTEWLKILLDPGTYYVRVEAAGAGWTRYLLRFHATAPVPVAASVSGDLLTVAWDTARDAFATPSMIDFAVRVDGAGVAVSAVRVAGNTVRLTLASPVRPQQTVAVDYLGSAMHPVSDADGLRERAWTDLHAVNLTATLELAGNAAVPEPADEGLAPLSLSLRGLGLAQLDAAALGNIASLRRLDLSGNALTDLRVLSPATELRTLDLSDNDLTDLWPLASLTELRRLDVSGNRIADLSALADLPNLEVLVVDANLVTDADALTHLARLENLRLADNAVADLEPLSDLSSLGRLDLHGNPATDASPLGDLGELVWLRLPAKADAPTERLVRLRWLWRGDAGDCVGCREAADR